LRDVKTAVVLFWGFLMGSLFLLALHADILGGNDFADAYAGIRDGIRNSWGSRFPAAVPLASTILTAVLFAPDILALWIGYIAMLFGGSVSPDFEDWSSFRVIAFSLYMTCLILGGVYFAEKYLFLRLPFNTFLSSIWSRVSSAYASAYATSGTSALLRNAGLGAIVPFASSLLGMSMFALSVGAALFLLLGRIRTRNQTSTQR
jgi:hypothetical protein